ncbi:FAD:protein FMN transferase [Streptomyces sp. NRRL WC-3742]|uniref:FAD:protein FMN transferase n=1 Tax=Streptomyces sp. NRRL WC-3742 TaxID=1463934 RepID=UPI0004CB4613|nr:FAD:protein FMN transferase [Streptomyces sp. NRRL WC-3742]
MTTPPLRHAEHVMGTVFSFTVRDPAPAALGALRRITDRLHELDTLFSPYRPNSPVSRLGRGELALADCDPQIAEALRQCARIAEETDGYFTDHPAGCLDPCGWVKGWAIEEASRALCDAGSTEHCVSGGGDVQTVGGPWRIGVAEPLQPGVLATVITGHDLAVATSGTAERGAHIHDPHTGRPATALASLTLVGRGIADTDAYATAAFAMGPDRALAWAEAHPDLEALAILPDGRSLATPGLARWTAV